MNYLKKISSAVVVLVIIFAFLPPAHAFTYSTHAAWQACIDNQAPDENNCGSDPGPTTPAASASNPIPTSTTNDGPIGPVNETSQYTTPIGPSEAPVTADGTTKYTLLEPLPCIGAGCKAGELMPTIDIRTYFVYIFGIAIAIAVFLAVVVITFAGFKYMTEESITKKGAAKDMIWNAVLGLLGALGSWLILYTINPQLVDLSLVTVPKLDLTYTDPLSGLNKLISQQNRQLTNNAIDQNAAAAIAQEEAQKKINTLEDSLNTNGCIDEVGTYIGAGNANCDALWAQYNTEADALDLAVSKQNVSKAIVNITAAQNVFEATYYSHTCAGCGPNTLASNTNIDDAKAAVKSIDTIYWDTVSKLSNNAVADKGRLTAQRTYSEASIVNDYRTNYIADALGNDLPTLGFSNTAVAEEHVALAKALIKQLQTYSIPNQSTSGGIITQPVGELTGQPDLLANYKTKIDSQISLLQDKITAVQKATASIVK